MKPELFGEAAIPEPIAPEPEEKPPEFPDTDGSLFYGGFKHYFDAYHETNETCKPFLMAGALSQVGVMAGRMACVSLGRKPTRRRRIYPNGYYAIVGKTAMTRKSSCVSDVIEDLQDADEMDDILFFDALASFEGAVQAMSFDIDGEPQTPETMDREEGRRLLLYPDELKSLFMNARRTSTNNIIPKLTEAYSCPRKMSVYTKRESKKTAPIVAYYPVWNILGATTGSWLQDSVSLSDLEGGFINRFGYWLYEFTPENLEPEDPHQEPLKEWYTRLKQLRAHGDVQNFVLSEAAWEIYSEQYTENRTKQWENPDSLETSATAREIFHTFKIALCFALMEDDWGDLEISAECWTHASVIADYLSQVSIYLFKNTGESVDVAKEDLVLSKLAKLGNDTTRTNLRTELGGKRMPTPEFNKILNALNEAGVIDLVGGRPERIIRVAK